jgi:hypothetical protein
MHELLLKAEEEWSLPKLDLENSQYDRYGNPRSI